MDNNCSGISYWGGHFATCHIHVVEVEVEVQYKDQR